MNVTVSGTAASPSSTPLHAIPFINPNGGVITQMGIHVSSAGTTLCDLGIYTGPETCRPTCWRTKGRCHSVAAGNLPSPFPPLAYGSSDTLYVTPNIYVGP